MRILPFRQVRLFHYTSILRKDEKSKQLLKNLGLSLQQGNLKPDEEDHESPPPTSASVSPPSIAPNTFHPLLHDQANIERMNNLYDTVSYMTTNDLTIQKNFDQGKQLFGYASQHVLDRKEIIRNLPEEIDILNPHDMDRLEEIYQDLDRLDSDKTVQLKLLKALTTKYDDPVTGLIQEFNGITKKFRLLRRNEHDVFYLGKDYKLFNANLAKLPYNVVGFDKSISGFPLRPVDEKASFPLEFIEDLQMFRTKIPVHKRDLDVIEHDEESTNIDPKLIQRFKEQLENGLKGEQVSEIFNNVFEVPKNTILVNGIENYNTLTLNKDMVIRIENEILAMRKSLQNEIETVIKTTSNILMYRNQAIKYNQFRLCETSSKPSPDSSSLLIINYHLKEFNLIPNYGLVLTSARQVKNLRNHLFKLFLINLEDEVSTLARIKYYNEGSLNKFKKRMLKNIGHVIKFKLRKLFKPLHSGYQDYDALVFSPYMNRSLCFKRIYPLVNNKPSQDYKNANMHSRRAQRIKVKKFDDLIDY